jgi:hypothetical protein
MEDLSLWYVRLPFSDASIVLIIPMPQSSSASLRGHTLPSIHTMPYVGETFDCIRQQIFIRTLEMDSSANTQSTHARPINPSHPQNALHHRPRHPCPRRRCQRGLHAVPPRQAADGAGLPPLPQRRVQLRRRRRGRFHPVQRPPAVQRRLWAVPRHVRLPLRHRVLAAQPHAPVRRTPHLSTH